VIEQHGTDSPHTINYTYDSARRLTKEQRAITREPHHYGIPLISVQTKEYTFDNRGNRIATHSTGDIGYALFALDYDMQNDPALHLFGGHFTAGNSRHPLLGSHSAIREILSSPRRIFIHERGGTSQGVDVRLWALDIKPHYEYTFEFTGRVVNDNGSQLMFINAVNGDSGAGTNFATLKQVLTSADGTFALSHTATYEQIKAHMNRGVLRYRLGGASAHDLLITGININETVVNDIFDILPPSDEWDSWKANENYNETYEYDFNNRLIRTMKTQTNGNAELRTYTYDRNGNQLTNTTTVDRTEMRTYNNFNQLTQVRETNSSVLTRYAYRADGLRHHKSTNGVLTTHVWDGANIVLERNTGGMVMNRFNRCLSGKLIKSDHHGWYLHNARGDVVQRVGDEKQVFQNYRYTAFGINLGSTFGSSNPFRYAGEYWDGESGEYYLRARSYNPRTGRFTQADPYWNIGNMQRSNRAILQAGNLYMYTMHNPIRWIDPWGLAAELGLNMGMVQSLMQAGHTTAAFAMARAVITGHSVTMSGNNAPVIMSRDGNGTGNNIFIFANLNIHGAGANSLVRGSSTVTAGQAALRGIIENWSGYREGPNGAVNVVTFETGPLFPGQTALNIYINKTHGMSSAPGGGSDGWTPQNPGSINLFLGKEGEHSYDAFQLGRVAAHEFGHSLGIGDGFGFGYNGNISRGEFSSIMTSHLNARGVTRLDVELAWAGHTSTSLSRWQNWRHSNIHHFQDNFGIGHRIHR
jgi:RHS repeat-associated protein